MTATWLALIGFAAGISFFVWTIVSTTNLNTCIVCKRHIHPETKTVAQVEGLKTILCCPACAQMLRDRRPGDDILVTQVTDYSTGNLIDARKAYVVTGSDVNFCAKEDVRLDGAKQPVPKIFDRCAPSMISFATLEAAGEFQTTHGGKLLPGDFAFSFEGR